MLSASEFRQIEIDKQLTNEAYNFGNRYWIHGLFDCCCSMDGIKAYLCSVCCPLCAAGEIYNKSGIGSWFSGCLLCFQLPCCYPCIFTNVIREKRGIRGLCVGDILLFYCCCSCQMTRELRELRRTNVNTTILCCKFV